MTTNVEKSIVVNVPVSTAYNQWTQFQDFPQIHGGHQECDPVERRSIGVGRRNRRRAPPVGGEDPRADPRSKDCLGGDRGRHQCRRGQFRRLGGGQTSVRLSLEYEPEGLVEKVGDKLNVVAHQAEGDLDRFKAFIEAEGYATGAWRGSVAEGSGVGTPRIDDADESRGDSGRAGVSGKTVAGAAAAAVAGVAAAAAVRRGSSGDDDEQIEVPARPSTWGLRWRLSRPTSSRSRTIDPETRQ